MKFARNVLNTFIVDVVLVGLNFVIGVLMARAMEPAARGVLALAMTAPFTVAYFIDPGLTQANVYLIGRKGRPVGAMVANSLTLAAVIGVGTAAILWLIRGVILRTLLAGLTEAQFTLLLLLLPLFLLDSYAMSILRALHRFDLFNLRRLLGQLILLVAMFLVLVVFNKAASGAVLAFVCAAAASAMLGLVFVGSVVGLRPGLHPKLLGESVSYGFKSYVQNLLGHLNYRLDVYLLAMFLDPAQVAFYAVATNVAELAWYIPNSVGTVLFPRLSATPPERVHPLTAEVCRHTVFVTALATLGLAAVSWLAIPLFYGAAYLPAMVPLFILLPGILGMAVYKVLTRNFSSLNRQQVSILAAVGALVLNVGLNVVFIPRYGIGGAATSSLISYALAPAILLIAFLRDSGLGWRDALVIRRDDLARYSSLFEQVREQAGRLLTRRQVQEKVQPVGGGE
ncbi:MAG: oligosaccharide flippase family protein [Chloroflexota bacterium]|nr:oligosaccharide flippase family protein [Chloroflexota bacterium]